MGHLHSVYDTDPHFQIKPDTREIINQSETKTKIMQYDHNSERFTFEIPRLVDGHDMTLCNRVEVHYINIDASTKETYSDVYEAEDVQVSPESEDVVIFSWLISQNATKFAGNLNFLVRFVCTDESATVVYAWNTDIFKAITVSNGIYNSETAITQYTDILEQWKDSLFDAGDSVMNNITTAGSTYVANIEAAEEEAVASVRNAGSTYSVSITNAENAAVNKVKSAGTEQVNAVELKGAQTLEKIPEEYAELDTRVKANQAELRIKADAIVQTVLGKEILVNDASNDYIRNLKLFGKTEQVTTTGKNILNNNATAKSANGVTFTINDDKSITINGTATASTYLNLDMDSTIDYQNTELIGSLGGGNNNVYMVIGYFDADGNVVDSICTIGMNEKTFTLPTNAVKARYYMYINVTTFNNVRVYPMIRLASITDDTYEPFTGNQPSPSPNYPQPLESVGKWGNLLTDLNGSRVGGTVNGVTFTVNKDKSISAKGTATALVEWQFEIDKTKLEPNKDYILSGSPSGASDNKFFHCLIETTSYGVTKEYGNGITFNYPTIPKAIYYRINVSSGQTIDVTFYPMISKESISYRPYSGQMKIESAVYGGNLLKSTLETSTEYGIICTKNNNGSYTLNGTATGNVTFVLDDYKKYYGSNYKLVGCPSGGSEYGYSLILNSKGSNPNIIDTGNGLLTNNAKDGEVYRIGIRIYNGVTLNNLVFKPMLTKDLNARYNDYVPYTKQSHISLVSDGLKGIPVSDSSLATYTDENGQMIRSDVTDYEKYVNVKRFHYEEFAISEMSKIEKDNTVKYSHDLEYVSDGNSKLKYCTHCANYMYSSNDFYHYYADGSFQLFVNKEDVEAFEATGKVGILYDLATPIETPLSASEIESYKKLHSNYWVTTMMNDCDAFSELKYNADTKLYIDNKFATLAAQLV